MIVLSSTSQSTQPPTVVAVTAAGIFAFIAPLM